MASVYIGIDLPLVRVITRRRTSTTANVLCVGTDAYFSTSSVKYNVVVATKSNLAVKGKDYVLVTNYLTFEFFIVSGERTLTVLLCVG